MIARSPRPADLLHLISRDSDGAEIRFGDCETVIRLKVSTDRDGVVRIVQSHWISPPDASRPERLGPATGAEARHALGAAIAVLSWQFRRGLSQGHLPNEGWFVGLPTLVGG